MDVAARHRDRLEQAAMRLRGQVLDSPLLGGLWLPGRPAAARLRLKLELLQPGGSSALRGVLHWTLRQLGSAKGLVAAGDARRLRAIAHASRTQRCPRIALAVPDASLDADTSALLLDGGWQVERPADAASLARRCETLQRESGYRRVPDAGDPDVDLGLATLGLELATDLPADCAAVVVADGALTVPVAEGLATAGRPLPVHSAGEGSGGEGSGGADPGLAGVLAGVLPLRLAAADVAAIGRGLELAGAGGEPVAVVVG